MKCFVTCIFGILCVLSLVKNLHCARILGIVPVPSYSHQIAYRKLWQELHNRGHEVVLITTNPMPNMNFTTFRQIDMGHLYKTIKAYDFVDLRFKGVLWMNYAETELWNSTHLFSDSILGHPEVQKMYAPDSNQTFDIIMAEMLYSTAIYVLAHRFNAPLIGLSSLGMLQLNEFALGGVVLPAHEYTWEMEIYIGANLSFWERLRNSLMMWRHLYITYHSLLPEEQSIAEKYFGKSIPPILDILRNTSLIFVNEGSALTPARPKLANMITFTAAHVSKIIPPAPEDLKEFMDSAKEGFIYFSLGSNAKSSQLPAQVLQIFIDVFAKLPYKVIWKFEKELKGAPKNIFYRPWLPQQTILAHPNVKLFIYQGGLQSTEETVQFTVPVIGFPILADQNYQMVRMEALGLGKRLDITTVTRKQLENAIVDIISNKKYRERMIEMRKIMNDHPYDTIQNLAWWTEYVIRHKGAPHFRSNLAWLPWYKRCDLDVIVFVTVVTCIILGIVMKVTFTLFMYVFKQTRSNSGGKKQKTS